MILNTKESNALIVSMAGDVPALMTADNISDTYEALPAILTAALNELARQWGTRAEEITTANKRGAKTSAAQWVWGMDRLYEAASALEREGLPDTPIDKASALAKTEATATMLKTTADAGNFVTLTCDTPDFVQGADHKPDRCLLSSSHQGDGSHHQGRYSRWPQRADDQARRTINATFVTQADAAAFISGATDVIPAGALKVGDTMQLTAFGEITPDQAAKLAALSDATMVIDGAFQSSEEFVAGPRPDDALDPAGAWAWDEMQKSPEERTDMTDIPEILLPDHDAPPAPVDYTRVRPFRLDEATAQPRRAHRSVSQVELFNECGMKYRLKYRDGVKTGTAWYLVGGTTFHACAKAVADRLPTMAHYDVNTAAGWSPNLAALWQTIFVQEIEKAEVEFGPRSAWRTSKSEGYDWWFINGEEMVRNYFAWHCSRLRAGWEILRIGDQLATELEFLTDVGGVKVKGFIDQTWYHHGLDIVEIIDFKTGNSAPGDTFQLGQYGWSTIGMSDVARVDNVTAGYYNPRKDVHTPTATPVLERHPWEEIVYQVTTMDAAERAGVYLANTQTNYGGCGSCELRKACPVGARR